MEQTRAGGDVLLSARDLTVQFPSQHGAVTAVDEVSFDIRAGEVISLVGESGCGKSTLGRAIIGLLPNSAKITGSLTYKGTELVGLDQGKLTQYRGTEMSMIFQEPMSSLNPVFRIGDQLAEAIQIRRARKRDKPGNRSVKEEVLEYLGQVKINDPGNVIDRYPHELSGGMRQRTMIAMSLAQRPSLLIADEPTTALDVTTQAQILSLMSELTREYDMSLLFITHDLGVAGMIASRIVVIYAGEIVEDSPVDGVFTETLHPYTKGLMASAPSAFKGGKRIEAIRGSMPNPAQTIVGCKFHERCPYVMDRCVKTKPRLLDHGKDRMVRCFLYDS
ncbi:MAG: ABC transporter ATP-binding protein [Thaumarchaeota archaeon]|nr:ABC transporter ATP-binding protein [Nitrososphaerota archaeon]